MPYNAAKFAEFQKKRNAQAKINDHTYLLQGEAGYSALAAAILNNARKDWYRASHRKASPEQIIAAKEMGYDNSLEELIDYFNGTELEVHCGLLNIPPENVRKKLLVPTKRPSS